MSSSYITDGLSLLTRSLEKPEFFPVWESSWKELLAMQSPSWPCFFPVLSVLHPNFTAQLKHFLLAPWSCTGWLTALPQMAAPPFSNEIFVQAAGLSLLSLISSLVPPHGSSHALHSSQLSAGSNCTVTSLKLPQTSVPFCPPSAHKGAAVCTISSRRSEQLHRAQVQLTFNRSPKFYCSLFMTNPTLEVCLFILYLCLTVSFVLTSQPRHAVGFGRRSVNSESFSGKCFFVFWFLYQVPDFSHESVQESWQHGSAADNYQVLCQLLPGVYWTLKQKRIKTKNTLKKKTQHSLKLHV